MSGEVNRTARASGGNERHELLITLLQQLVRDRRFKGAAETLRLDPRTVQSSPDQRITVGVGLAILLASFAVGTCAHGLGREGDDYVFHKATEGPANPAGPDSSRPACHFHTLKRCTIA